LQEVKNREPARATQARIVIFFIRYSFGLRNNPSFVNGNSTNGINHVHICNQNLINGRFFLLTVLLQNTTFGASRRLVLLSSIFDLPLRSNSKFMFGLRRFIVFNRLWIAIALIALGIYLGVSVTWWLGWLPIFVAILMVVAHFLVGPVTIIQRYIEEGDVEGAQKILSKVKYPNLLYKPVRSAYYMLKANFSTMSDDLDLAESELKKGLAAGTADKDFQGTALLQLGSIAYRKGNMKEAYEHLRKAVQSGLPDADSNATAYLQLASICLQRRDFKGSKFYFTKAKAAKPKNEQIIEQLNEMKKYMSRIPG
jgi:hypothetical protein